MLCLCVVFSIAKVCNFLLDYTLQKPKKQRNGLL